VNASLRTLVLAAAMLAATPAFAAKRALGPNERIDLNSAGTSELMRLPGVGEKRAQAIVAARARKPFRRPEDVLVVKGIGPAWLAKVKSNVVVGAPGPAPVPAKPGRS
jgi:competence protein ComEA